jgi:hypothetical protein
MPNNNKRYFNLLKRHFLSVTLGSKKEQTTTSSYYRMAIQLFLFFDKFEV